MGPVGPVGPDGGQQLDGGHGLHGSHQHLLLPLPLLLGRKGAEDVS